MGSGILRFMDPGTIAPSKRMTGSALAERVFRPAFLCIALLVATTFCCVPRSMADPDIWWHLRNAQMLVSTHQFIGTDVYSFTARGARWMNHEWIAELPFYFGWAVDGERGVYLITVAAVESLILGIFVLAYRKSRNLGGALMVSLVAALLSTVSYGPRTILFGWLLLTVELLILDASENDERVLWGLPVLFAVWVNTHGSWLIGLVMMGGFGVLEARRFRHGKLFCDGMRRSRLVRLGAMWIASVGALFVNPYGWPLVAYPFNLAFRQKLNVANVLEWKSLDLHSPRGLILLGLIALLVASQLGRGREWRLYELAYLSLGVYAALTYTRFLVLFSVVAAPVMAASFSIEEHEERGRRRMSPMLSGAVVFFLLCLVYARFRDASRSGAKEEAAFPAEAIPFLVAHPLQGRVFNECLWGGYMIWHLRAMPVFIDSRLDIFEYNGTLKDYLDIVRVNNSLALLDRYHIQYVFFEKDTPLVYLLRHAGGWKVDFEEHNLILLERSGDERRDGSNPM